LELPLPAASAAAWVFSGDNEGVDDKVEGESFAAVSTAPYWSDKSLGVIEAMVTLAKVAPSEDGEVVGVLIISIKVARVCW
jgi:hypothetical protein